MRHLTVGMVAAGSLLLAFGLAGRAIAQEAKSRRGTPPVVVRPLPGKPGGTLLPEAIILNPRASVLGRYPMPIARKDPSLYSIVIVPRDAGQYPIRVLPPQGIAEVLPTPPPHLAPVEPLLLEPVNGGLPAPDPQDVSPQARLLLKDDGNPNR